MRIHKSSKKDDIVVSQLSNAWRDVDFEHFGQVIDEWKKEEFFIYAEDNGEALGYVLFNVEMGVAYIHELLVSTNHRRKGIGITLMKEAESTAHAQGAHLIYLTTGKEWKERKFYEAIGYTKSADLPNHYLGVDFIHLMKEL